MHKFMLRRQFSSMIIARNLPTEWSAYDIVGHFNDNRVKKINFIKNKEGEKTGKAILHYRSQKEAEHFINTHSGKSIMDNTVVFEPYTSTNAAKGKDVNKQAEGDFQDKISKRIYIQNLSPEVTKDDIYALTKNLSDVQEIKLPLTEEGVNKGFGIVHLSSKDHVATAINSLENKEVFGNRLSVSTELQAQESSEESRLSDKLDYVKYLKRKYIAGLDMLSLPFTFTPSLQLIADEHLEGTTSKTEKERILRRLMSPNNRTMEKATELAVLEYKKIMFG